MKGCVAESLKLALQTVHKLDKILDSRIFRRSKNDFSHTASTASFNVKGPRPGLLTRNTRVSGNKYKMADALHRVARKS